MKTILTGGYERSNNLVLLDAELYRNTALIFKPAVITSGLWPAPTFGFNLIERFKP
jgi:hypothetical protein